MITQFKDNYRWLSNFWFYDNPMLIATEFGILRALSNEHFYVLTEQKLVCAELGRLRLEEYLNFPEKYKEEICQY